MARIMPLVSFPRNPRPAPTAPCRGVIFRRLIGSSKSCASSTAITASSPPSGAWPRANPGSKRPRKPRSRSPRRRALARKRRRKPLKCFNPRPVLARLKATRGRGMRTRKRAKPLHFARRPTIRSRSRLRQSARKWRRKPLICLNPNPSVARPRKGRTATTAWRAAAKRPPKVRSPSRRRPPARKWRRNPLIQMKPRPRGVAQEALTQLERELASGMYAPPSTNPDGVRRVYLRATPNGVMAS